MRVLIQNCLTNKFLSPNHKWVNAADQAQNYEKTLRAWSEIDDRKLSGVRIVLHTGDGHPEIQLATVDSGGSSMMAVAQRSR
jgi:hypothetical protein